MPRQRREQAKWSHRFELDPDDPGQAALHQYLVVLGRRGKASAWAIGRLVEALPPDAGEEVPVRGVAKTPSASHPAKLTGASARYLEAVQRAREEPDEPVYQDVDEP